ncbi:MAG: hypothetical protein Q9187_009280, partial [Circinaria calcarea]
TTMPLDEATPYDNTPTSDTDPYAFPNPDSPPPAKININLSELPRPNPIIGGLFGYTDQRLINLIHRRVSHMAKNLQRNPTTDEATAIAYWTAKRLAIASWGKPLGLAAGLYRAYATRGTFRFPFVAPNPETFQPNWVGIGGLELLRGHAARSFWHAARGTSYGYLGMYAGYLIVAGYSTTVAVVGEILDPRLKEHTEIMKTTKPSELEKRRLDGVANSTGQGQKTASELLKEHRESLGATQADDASPSAGGDYSYMEGLSDGEFLSRNDSGLMSDEQREAQEIRQQASPQKSRTSSRASTFDIDKVEKQPRSFDGDFDDARTTAENPSSNSSSGGGGAWERIRSQASSAPSTESRSRRRPGQMSPVQQEQQDGSTTGD